MTGREFEAQLRQVHPDCFGWALNCCGHDEMEAEDVLQTAYTKVLSGKAKFDGRSSFKTWLFGVIRRTSQEAGRRIRASERRTIRLEDGGMTARASEDPAKELGRAERARELARALSLLPERQREVLHLVFYQDLSIAEAAAVMGVSVGSARTHYKRGKKRMKALLQEGDTRDG